MQQEAIMKGKIALISIVLVATAVFSGCSKSDKAEKKDKAVKQEVSAQKIVTPLPSVRQGGIVVETFDTEGYTYLNLEDSEKVRFWAAVPSMKVKIGDGVEIAGGSPMSNFHSKTLNRTFDSIIFAGSARVVGAEDIGKVAQKLPSDHPPRNMVQIAVEGIEKVKGGYTVAELYANKKELADKEVKVRGKVVKYMEGIMGKNWVHLRDGTGSAGTNDITITTKQRTKVGDVIVAEGKLSINRDFGGGYNYPVIIEDSNIIQE
jgi:hypothetical protein